MYEKEKKKREEEIQMTCQEHICLAEHSIIYCLKQINNLGENVLCEICTYLHELCYCVYRETSNNAFPFQSRSSADLLHASQTEMRRSSVS